MHVAGFGFTKLPKKIMQSALLCVSVLRLCIWSAWAVCKTTHSAVGVSGAAREMSIQTREQQPYRFLLSSAWGTDAIVSRKRCEGDKLFEHTHIFPDMCPLYISLTHTLTFRHSNQVIKGAFFSQPIKHPP